MPESKFEYPQKQENETPNAPVNEATERYSAAPRDRDERRAFLRALLEEEFPRMEPSLRYLADQTSTADSPTRVLRVGSEEQDFGRIDSALKEGWDRIEPALRYLADR